MNIEKQKNQWNKCCKNIDNNSDTEATGGRREEQKPRGSITEKKHHFVSTPVKELKESGRAKITGTTVAKK